jgi:hypothetical protein
MLPRLAEEKGLGLFASLPERLSTINFLERINDSSEYANQRVISVTWVKALASHMSHEFLQFVVEDVSTGRRGRLLSDRQETGDWILVPEPGESTSSKPSWRELSAQKRRHSLPLPLVSVMFEEPRARPTLLAMAKLLVETTNRCPEYNPLREMCWWYAEAVIDSAQMAFQGTRTREWRWAKYRYSFVLCNNWIKRKTLEKDAEEFEQYCSREFVY